jgi:hypothetical protein
MVCAFFDFKNCGAGSESVYCGADADSRNARALS